VIVQSKQNFIARILAFVTTWSLILGASAKLKSISGTSYPTALREYLPGTVDVAFFKA
jgi:hypothetical protein